MRSITLAFVDDMAKELRQVLGSSLLGWLSEFRTMQRVAVAPLARLVDTPGGEFEGG